MKKVLLISDEKEPQDAGRIENSESYGFTPELYNLPNLRAVLLRQDDVAVEILHHTELLAAPACDYVVLSGRFSPRDLNRGDEEYRILLDFIRANSAPMLGICAGFHLISRAFGSEIVPMDDTSGEFGYREMRIRRRHPMLQGFEKSFTCMQLHRYTISAVPDGFEWLASTEKCPVQMIMHRERPIVGMQFHPELQNETHRDGEILLRNFFKQY